MNRASGSRTLTAPLLLLALLAAFGFGAVVKVALADHYHASGPSSGSCSSPHGMVHGTYTRDGSWHARVEINNCPHTFKRCVATHYDGYPVLADDRSYSTTCNAHYNGSRDELYGLADVYYETTFSPHMHDSHYF